MEISQIGEAGLARLVEMAAGEGWNPGRHDVRTFFEADPEGFVGVHEADNLIGGGAIVRHSDGFGFMGLFLMAAEFRGRGIGRKLWYARRDRLLARLGPGATIGMDGVSAMVGFYQEGGFEPQYLSSRFQLRGGTHLPQPDANLIPLSEARRDEIEDLDRRSFPGERTAYLSAWLHQPEAHALAYRDRTGRISGYGTIRPCREGRKIGPLFAENPEAAHALIVALIAAAEGETVSIDVPSVNPVAEGLCRSLGMESVFACTRMYFGPKPVYDPSLIYGLTSFELG